MDPKISKVLLKLEKERELFIGEYSSFNKEQQQFKPSPDVWNMNQVLDHLLSTEKISFNFLISKNYKESRHAKGFRHFFNTFILVQMLKSPLRFKVPRVKGLLPADEKSPDSNRITDWKNTGEQARRYLTDFPHEKTGDLIFRHPIAGWINIIQTITFLKEHIRHHRMQLRRIKSAKGFPG